MVRDSRLGRPRSTVVVGTGQTRHDRLRRGQWRRSWWAPPHVRGERLVVAQLVQQMQDRALVLQNGLGNETRIEVRKAEGLVRFSIIPKY